VLRSITLGQGAGDATAQLTARDCETPERGPRLTRGAEQVGLMPDYAGISFDTVSELVLVIQMLVPSKATPNGLSPVG
jgi:hypothetical protein